MSNLRLAIALVAFLLAAAPVPAIIFQSTGDPNFNTTAPTGTNSNSGWQYAGRWGDFMGTVIGPRYFMTAKHINTTTTQAGSLFTFQGQTYTALTSYNDPSSDLRIWRVCGTFPPPYAPLYTAGLEVNKAVILIGRGTSRGTEVRAGLTNGLKGWAWGNNDSIQRWGWNTVSGLLNGGGAGFQLTMRFNAGAGPDEGHLSYGDSGGPVFVLDGTWKLAGVNYASDGYYSTTMGEPGFYGALFDESDLFKQVNQVWVPGTPTPGSCYATRVSARITWINGILNQAPPADPVPVLESAPAVGAAFAEEPAAVVNGPTRTITVPVTGAQRFFRLSACTPYRITNISVGGGNVILTYQ